MPKTENLSPADIFANAERAFEREFESAPSVLNNPSMRLIFVRSYMSQQR